MNKKISLIIIALLSLICILVCFDYGDGLTNNGQFSSYYKTNKEILNICASRTEAKNDLINELYFDDNQLFYDSNAKCFYYSLVEGSNTAYNPSIKCDGKVNFAFDTRTIDNEMLIFCDYVTGIVSDYVTS